MSDMGGGQEKVLTEGQSRVVGRLEIPTIEYRIRAGFTCHCHCVLLLVWKFENVSSLTLCIPDGSRRVRLRAFDSMLYMIATFRDI